MNKMTLLNAKLAAKMITQMALQKVMRDLLPEEVNNEQQMATESPIGMAQPAGGSVPSGASGDIYQPSSEE